MAQTLSICSWNINSVRARIDIVEQLLRQEAPDILCLQETKVVNETFPTDMFRRMGYVHQVLNGQRMHHGVAILSKVPIHEDDRLDWQANGEARHVGVRLDNGVRIENVYVPAGGDVPDRTVNPKFGQKLDFLERMIEWSAALEDKPTILTGDFNIDAIAVTDEDNGEFGFAFQAPLFVSEGETVRVDTRNGEYLARV